MAEYVTVDTCPDCQLDTLRIRWSDETKPPTRLGDICTNVKCKRGD